MRVFTTLPQENLQKVAPAAQKIELHTGVAISFPRSPMVAANIGWDLAASSGGRFTLGLGSQIRPHNEKRFSVPWSAPAPRMREYIQSVRAIWVAWKGDGKLNYEGKHYRFTLMTPNFVPEPYDAPAPRITLAAVGPAMLKASAEEADGVKLHVFCTRKYLEESTLPLLADGLAHKGKEREAFEIS